MNEGTPFVVGALVVIAGLLAYPYGDAYVKLLLLFGGTLLLAIGVARVMRKRSEGKKPAHGREPSSRFYRRTPLSCF